MVCLGGALWVHERYGDGGFLPSPFAPSFLISPLILASPPRSRLLEGLEVFWRALYDPPPRGGGFCYECRTGYPEENAFGCCLQHRNTSEHSQQTCSLTRSQSYTNIRLWLFPHHRLGCLKSPFNFRTIPPRPIDVLCLSSSGRAYELPLLRLR